MKATGTVSKRSRRQFLHLAATASALPAVSHLALAQTYPSRPVNLIVFVPAGGNPDITHAYSLKRCRNDSASQ